MAERNLVELGQGLAEAVFIGPRKKAVPRDKNMDSLTTKQKWGGVEKKKLHPLQEEMVKKSSSQLVKRLRELAILNTQRAIDAFNRGVDFDWKYPNQERAINFGVYHTGTRGVYGYESDDYIHTHFEIYPDDREIKLLYFYYVSENGHGSAVVPKEYKEKYPPYMTMYFLQSFADAIDYTIKIPDDASSRSNDGASYYASNYGFSPSSLTFPSDNLTREPCSQDLEDWISKRCTETLEECIQNAENDSKLEALKRSTCWSQTKDILYNFGNSKTRYRRNEGYAKIKYREYESSRYSGEMRKFQAEGQGTVQTPNGQWMYKGEFENSEPHGFGVETGPGGFRREGYWHRGEATEVALPDAEELNNLVSELLPSREIQNHEKPDKSYAEGMQQADDFLSRWRPPPSPPVDTMELDNLVSNILDASPVPLLPPLPPYAVALEQFGSDDREEEDEF